MGKYNLCIILIVISLGKVTFADQVIDAQTAQEKAMVEYYKTLREKPILSDEEKSALHAKIIDPADRKFITAIGTTVISEKQMREKLVSMALGKKDIEAIKAEVKEELKADPETTKESAKLGGFVDKMFGEHSAQFAKGVNDGDGFDNWFEKNQEKFTAAMDKNIQNDSASDSKSQTYSRGSKQKSSSPSSPSSKDKHETVIDGSDVPKVVEFPGTK
ncbi:MAG: hypothetical protein AABZ06_12310 [Bdellovibrionota bacterium]